MDLVTDSTPEASYQSLPRGQHGVTLRPEGMTIDGLSPTEIDRAIETLTKLKLKALEQLPRIHSVWGPVNNPIGWVLVTRVGHGLIKFKSYQTGNVSELTYEKWSDLLNGCNMVDITNLVGTT